MKTNIEWINGVNFSANTESGNKIMMDGPVDSGGNNNGARPTELLISGATDYCRVDPNYDGGITVIYKAAITAETLGFDVEVHSCGPAMRQLMGALSKSNYYELNLVHPKAPNPWQLPIYADDYSDELDCINSDGTVDIPTSPGLGVKYNWDKINKYTNEKIIIN